MSSHSFIHKLQRRKVKQNEEHDQANMKYNAKRDSKIVRFHGMKRPALYAYYITLAV
jgi:hypothetical protein